MGYKSIVTTLTAQNATETNKTLIDTITVPQGVSKLVEVLCDHLAGTAGLTTLEAVSGILELESDDMSPWGGTQQFLLDNVIPLTSGVATLKPTVHPTDIPVTPGSHIKVSTTFDLAQTINPKVRAQLVFR